MNMKKSTDIHNQVGKIADLIIPCSTGLASANSSTVQPARSFAEIWHGYEGSSKSLLIFTG